MVQQTVQTFSFSKNHCHTEWDQSMVLHVTWEDIRILMSHLWGGNGFGVGPSWPSPLLSCPVSVLFLLVTEYLCFLCNISTLTHLSSSPMKWPCDCCSLIRAHFRPGEPLIQDHECDPKGANRRWTRPLREGFSSPKTVRSVSLALYTHLERGWLKNEPINRKTDLGDDRKTKGERLPQRERQRENII